MVVVRGSNFDHLARRSPVTLLQCLGAEAVPSSFLATENPCSDNPTWFRAVLNPRLDSCLTRHQNSRVRGGLVVSFGVKATDFTDLCQSTQGDNLQR